MSNNIKFYALTLALLLLRGNMQAQEPIKRWRATGNPIIRHKFTADPAPFVKGDTLYLYTGIDYAGDQKGYKMHEWGLFTTTDMMCWEEHPSPLRPKDFSWASNSAYAAHVTEKNGKYYYYVSTNTTGIGVAVSDSPYGPFKDALGKQLLTNKDCHGTTHSWACIDPAVYTDKDGQSWITWGNRRCFIAKLKDNMTEIDGEIRDITPVGSDFTEAPWIHMHDGRYYLTFACGWPEKLGYAVADKIEGPYHYEGVFSEVAGNCTTTHPGIVEFKGKTWLFTHDATLREGTGASRCVGVEELKYDSEGHILSVNLKHDSQYLVTNETKKLKNSRTPKLKNSLTTAYLFAYFEGKGERQEELRFAVSENARDWHALNGNQPILGSDTISSTGGIRDPHILRGEGKDGYYIVATDMHVAKNGWGHNPGIVLLHSDDLVHWSHSVVDFTKQYPETFGNVRWVWAPQTIYDSNVGKYLVYFTICQNDAVQPDSIDPTRSTLDFYCAYANKDFTALEAEPRLMFSATYGAIDGDIIIDERGLYHFFYKGNLKDKNAHEYKNGIMQAVSHSLEGPWYEDGIFIDAYADTKTGVEGSGVFRLNDKDCSVPGQPEYVLMYDLFSSGRYEFQRTKDLLHFSRTPESFTKDFMPRHGTVLPITKKEYKRLCGEWLL